MTPGDGAVVNRGEALDSCNFDFGTIPVRKIPPDTFRGKKIKKVIYYPQEEEMANLPRIDHTINIDAWRG